MLMLVALAAGLPIGAAHAQNKGLHTDDDATSSQFGIPKAVRNAQPLAGEEVTILRSFKIKKGNYPEFYRQSVTGIWPYFEKIGARIVGMWQVDHGALDIEKSAGYDEAILLTRYASLAHWRASRAPFELGGNGPDAEALAKAHQYRQSVTLETSFKILNGKLADNGPYHMPAVKD
ncbi:MAG: hypothetical protein ABJN65_04535 [Parasphingorhabdus sp.]